MGMAELGWQARWRWMRDEVHCVWSRPRFLMLRRVLYASATKRLAVAP